MALPKATPAYTTQQSIDDQQMRLALSDLQGRYNALNKPEPSGSGKAFFDWLQDFGTSMQKSAVENPSINTLGALGTGFSGATQGIKRRKAERAKLTNMNLQNLGMEMSMLKAKNELGPVRYASAAELRAAGLPKGTSAIMRGGRIHKILHKPPTESNELFTFQDLTHPTKASFSMKKNDPRIDAVLSNPTRYRKITGQKAVVPPPHTMSLKEMKEHNLNPLNKYRMDHTGDITLLEKHDSKTYQFQNTNPDSEDYLKVKEVGAENGELLADLRTDEDWNAIALSSAKKADKAALTAENTGEGGKYADKRQYFDLATERGDIAEVSPDGGVTFKKGSAAKTIWKPVSNEQALKDGVEVYPGMYAEKNQDGSIKLRSKPKQSYLTFTDPNGIQRPVTVREDEIDLIKALREDGYIKGEFKGDLATAGKSAISRWMQGRENTQFGKNIINMIREHIGYDRNNVGAVAKVKGAYQTVESIAVDVLQSGILGEAQKAFSDTMVSGGLDPKALNTKVAGTEVREWFNTSIGAAAQLEQTLIYTIAMANKPSGRLNLQDLQRAENQVKVTGFGVSVDDVITSLNVADRVFDLRSASYDRLIGGKKGSSKAAPKEKKPVRMRRGPNGYEPIE